MIELGAVADDLTGATDLALMLTAAGYRTLVVVGDHRPALTDVDAAVVALKSRTAPVAEAVRDSLAATSWLREAGAQRLYVKYCSTFDSTAEGNIGPVVSAVLAQQEAPLTVVVPSFPATGRTVYQGHLFVGRTLLERSPMRDHPLTPMRDSDVVALLSAQTDDPVGLIPLPVVRSGAGAVRAALAAHRRDGVRLVVVDATEDADLAVVAQATADLAVLTGGSALAGHLPPPRGGAFPADRRPAAGRAGAGQAGTSQAVRQPGAEPVGAEQAGAGRAGADQVEAARAAGRQVGAGLTGAEPVGAKQAGAVQVGDAQAGAGGGSHARVVLSGSASAATRRQVAAGLRAGHGLRLSADEVRTPQARGAFLDRAVAAALGTPEGRVLVVYTVAQASDLGDPADAGLLESVLGELAVRLTAAGVRRLLVAGGETSGAVIAALGVESLRLYPPLSPGVGWAHATRADGGWVDLVLKSGNFGTEDLFVSAWDRAPDAAGAAR